MNASIPESLRVGALVGLFVVVLPWIWAPLTAGILLYLFLGCRTHVLGFAIAGALTSAPFILIGMKAVGDVIFDLDDRPLATGIVIAVSIAASGLFVWVGTKGFEQFRQGIAEGTSPAKETTTAEQGVERDAGHAL